MRLSQIRLENFRNYKQISINIDSDLVLILGENAAGKTNFLESIYFISQLKSFRSPDHLLVKSGEEYFTIAGEGASQRGALSNYEVVVQSQPIIKRGFKINGQRVKRGIWKSFTTVLFAPNDLNLFFLGPALRRKYLDDTLSQISKGYAMDLLSLEHVLKQRRTLLEQIMAGSAQREELGFWNEQLISLTLRIGQERKKFLDFVAHKFAEVYQSLTGFTNNFTIDYKTYADEQLPKKLQEHQESEIRSGQNLVGPHREDFLITKDGQTNIHNSSRGELRSQILAIKLLQAEYLDQHQMPPIILLDDVFSELDETRRTKLLESLKGHQIFITTTEEHHLPEIKSAQKIKVDNGKVA